MYIRKLGVMGTMLLSMAAQGAESNPLLGCWVCDSGGSRMSLHFYANQYVIDGEPLAYRLVPGAIKVPEPDGFSLYPYKLEKGRLTINVDDTPPLICTSIACPAGATAM
jgi:hypothetical protein